MLGHQEHRPSDLRMPHAQHRPPDPRKPHHDRRLPKRSDGLSAAWGWQGVSRMSPRLRHVPWLAAATQGDLSGRWLLNPPLALSPRPPVWYHHLACPLYAGQSRVHGPPALRLALSPDAPGGGPRCRTGDAWGAQFGAVRRALPSLSHARQHGSLDAVLSGVPTGSGPAGAHLPGPGDADRWL